MLVKKASLFLILSTLFLPQFAYAQQTFADLIYSFVGIDSIADRLVTLLVGVGLVVFIWGVIRYMTAGADNEQMRRGRKLMLWGIIGLFVMVSMWGLVNIVRDTFFPNLQNNPPNPLANPPGYQIGGQQRLELDLCPASDPNCP